MPNMSAELLIAMVNCYLLQSKILQSTLISVSVSAPDTAQWASLGVEMDKNPGAHFLDILCCK